MKRWLTLFTASFLIVALGCGVPESGDDDDDDTTASPSPTPVSFALNSGTYDYNVTQEISDTCWQPPKTNVEVPLLVIADVVSDGTNVTISATIQDVPLVFNVTKTGDDLAGTGAGDLDLNAAAGIDCVIHVEGTLTGTMTADDAFTAVHDFDITEGSGGQCALAVGTLSPDQLDSLPCALSLGADATIQ